jgi:hypothetical protein
MRPKMLDRGAKGGVHDGLNNDQPRCARGPVQAARPREALANVGTFASHASQGGPPVFAPLARTARATTCKPGKHQSAGQRRSRSSAELSGLRLLKLASNRSGKRFRALLPRVLPNTGPYLRSPRPYVSTHRGTRKACMVLESKPTAIPAPRPLGSVTPLAGENCHMRLDRNARHPPMCVRRRTSVAA